MLRAGRASVPTSSKPAPSFIPSLDKRWHLLHAGQHVTTLRQKPGGQGAGDLMGVWLETQGRWKPVTHWLSLTDFPSPGLSASSECREAEHVRHPCYDRAAQQTPQSRSGVNLDSSGSGQRAPALQGLVGPTPRHGVSWLLSGVTPAPPAFPSLQAMLPWGWRVGKRACPAPWRLCPPSMSWTSLSQRQPPGGFQGERGKELLSHLARGPWVEIGRAHV